MPLKYAHVKELHVWNRFKVGLVIIIILKNVLFFIERVKEHRHGTTLERHLKKYDWLCQKNTGGHSNTQHHTCMAQSTALTSDAVTSPTTTSPASAVTSLTSTTPTVQSKWMKNLLEAPSQKPKCPYWPINPISLWPQEAPHMGNTSLWWNKHVRTWSHTVQKS